MLRKARMSEDIALRVAEESQLPVASVRATIRLLAEGGSVPFLARYRKEQTGGLDEVQIRTIEEKNGYFVELDSRKTTILAEIESQGKLTPELKARIQACQVKSTLEDIYLPFKPKRRTRAMIARERGLAPLADLLLSQPMTGSPDALAAVYVDLAKEVPDAKAALAGARDIVAEALAERTEVRAHVREVFKNDGVLACEALKDKSTEPTKFEMYYGFEEKVSAIPSHRFLAIRRGENEGVLRAAIAVDKDAIAARIETLAKKKPGSPFAGELELAVKDSVTRLLCPSLESEVRV